MSFLNSWVLRWVIWLNCLNICLFVSRVGVVTGACPGFPFAWRIKLIFAEFPQKLWAPSTLRECMRSLQYRSQGTADFLSWLHTPSSPFTMIKINFEEAYWLLFPWIFFKWNTNSFLFCYHFIYARENQFWRSKMIFISLDFFDK